MEMIMLACVALLIVAACSKPARRFFKSIFTFAESKANSAAETVANADPIGVYKMQISNAIESGANASKVVEQAARQLESLQRQVDAELKEQQRITSRIQAVIQNGDPNKTAEKYALELERIESSLAANQQQLEIAQNTYNDNLQLVSRYEQQVSQARKDAEKLGFQLQQSEAEKNLNQMTANMREQLCLGDLAQARERVQAQIDANRGASRAAHDLSQQGLAEEADEELERKQRATEILARLQK
jgi:phage shock protein A